MTVEGLPRQPALSAQERSSRLQALEAGRAVAALMVVAFHAHQQTIPRAYDGADSWDGLAMGDAGVEFFFVLSGFIMLYAHRGRLGDRGLCSGFLYGRFVRIFPLYWLVFLPLISLYLLLGKGPDHARDLLVAIGQSALLPVGDHMILTVAWTLSHEMLFYVIFAALFLSRALGRAVLLAWFTGCAFFFLTGTPRGALEFVFSHYNLLFFFGMAAAFVHSAIPPRVAAIAAGAGACLFLAAGLSDALGWRAWNPETLTVTFGFFAAVVVACLAAHKTLRVPGLAVFLGAASYSIYLVHYPVINFTGRLIEATELNRTLGPSAALPLVILIGIVAGVMLHQFVEKPLVGSLRGMRRNRSPAG